MSAAFPHVSATRKIGQLYPRGLSLSIFFFLSSPLSNIWGWGGGRDFELGHEQL